MTPTNVEVRLVDQPKGESIFVALDRVRRCYSEQGNTTWTGHKKKHRQKVKPAQSAAADVSSDLSMRRGPITRSRSCLQDEQ